MRTSSLALLAVLPGIAVAQAARLEQADGEPRIVVTATRTSHLPPDRAAIYVLVEGTGESPTEAAQRGGQKMQAVSNAIRQSGVLVEAASGVPYGVAPAPNLTGFPGSPSQTSYIARFAIRVQVARVEQLLPLTVSAITAGASGASPPVFEASGTDSARRVRVTEALAAARQDAEALAAALGGRLGSLIEVSTTAPGPFTSPNYVSFTNRYDYSSPAQPPDITVAATVTVRYRFLPR